MSLGIYQGFFWMDLASVLPGFSRHPNLLWDLGMGQLSKVLVLGLFKAFLRENIGLLVRPF